jgi:hypothetical protein
MMRVVKLLVFFRLCRGRIKYMVGMAVQELTKKSHVAVATTRPNNTYISPILADAAMMTIANLTCW